MSGRGKPITVPDPEAVRARIQAAIEDHEAAIAAAREEIEVREAAIIALRKALARLVGEARQ